MKKYLSVIFPLLVVVLFSCQNIAKYPMDDPSAEFVFDSVVGKWRVEEDSDKNNFIDVSKGSKQYRYHVICWDNGGTNPAYESYVHFSKLNNFLFLNVACWDDERDKSYYQETGYMFYKVIYMTPDYSKMVLACVSDTTLGSKRSKLEVFNYVARNLNNKAFYSDTMHLYKVQ